MKVTIDTNIFVQDFLMKSPTFDLFFDKVDQIPASVHICEVVIDETINKYRESLKEMTYKFEKSISQLKKRHGVSLKTEKLDYLKHVDLYKKLLYKYLKEKKVHFLDYPETKHRDIVERIFQRKLPFKNGEDGYRDFLIWESIRNLDISGQEQIIFVTNNTSDFGTGSHISDEYKDLFSNPQNFRIINSLSKFNEEFIVPHLKKLEIVKKKLEDNKITGFNFIDWVNKSLISLFQDLDLDEVLLGFKNTYSIIRFSEISLIHDFEIESVREINSREKLIKFKISLKVAFSFDLGWDEYIRDKDVRTLLGPSFDFNAHATCDGSEDIIVFGFLTLNDKNEVTGEEIMKVDGPYDSYEITF